MFRQTSSLKLLTFPVMLIFLLLLLRFSSILRAPKSSHSYRRAKNENWSSWNNSISSTITADDTYTYNKNDYRSSFHDSTSSLNNNISSTITANDDYNNKKCSQKKRDASSSAVVSIRDSLEESILDLIRFLDRKGIVFSSTFNFIELLYCLEDSNDNCENTTNYFDILQRAQSYADSLIDSIRKQSKTDPKIEYDSLNEAVLCLLLKAWKALYGHTRVQYKDSYKEYMSLKCPNPYDKDSNARCAESNRCNYHVSYLSSHGVRIGKSIHHQQLINREMKQKMILAEQCCTIEKVTIQLQRRIKLSRRITI